MNRGVGDRGVVTTELVIVMPVLICFLFMVIAAGRLTDARSDVVGAAGDAARVASLQRSAATARVQAQAAATDTVSGENLNCKGGPQVETEFLPLDEARDQGVHGGDPDGVAKADDPARGENRPHPGQAFHAGQGDPDSEADRSGGRDRLGQDQELAPVETVGHRARPRRQQQRCEELKDADGADQGVRASHLENDDSCGDVLEPVADVRGEVRGDVWTEVAIAQEPEGGAALRRVW